MNVNLNNFFNYGLWEIDVPAGKNLTVTKQDIDNKPGGTISAGGENVKPGPMCKR